MPNYILRFKKTVALLPFSFCILESERLCLLHLLKLTEYFHDRIPNGEKNPKKNIVSAYFDYSPNLSPSPALADPRGSSCANYALCAGLLFWQWSLQLHDWHGNRPVNTQHCASPSVHRAQPHASWPTEIHSQ